MSTPTVSVVVPAYGQAEYLGEAIASVLDQTYTNLEVVVVNDASPDATDDVVRQFTDPRITYVTHDVNRGLPAARNTGIDASRGSLLAFLDADDYFHRDKIAAHVARLAQFPALGLTYAWRFNLNCGQPTIRDLWQPPGSCTLSDLVLGFPFAPSDMVIRREWLVRVGQFDAALTDMSEDLDICCRLALLGCPMAGIPRALTYRRYYSGRRLRVRRRHAAAMKVLEAVFADPRCPPGIRSLRPQARAAHTRTWALHALVQGDTTIGQDLLRAAVRDDPSVLAGHPSPLVRAMLRVAIADESQNHDEVLTAIVDQCPAELQSVRRDYDWAVGHGHVLRAVRAALWERLVETEQHFARAAALGAEIDPGLLQGVTHDLIGLEQERGSAAGSLALERLERGFESIGGPWTGRKLRGCFAVNRAFRHHREARPREVLTHVGQALVYDPRYLANWGVWSMVVGSLVPVVRRQWSR